MRGLMIAARALHFAAGIGLVGIFAFDCLVLGPALGGAGATFRGAVALRRRFGRSAWLCLLLLLLSGALWLVAAAAEMSGKSLGAALMQGIVPIVLSRTRFGQDWLLRLACAGLLAVCLLAWGSRRRRAHTASAWAAFGLGMLMLVSLAWAGHGAATSGRAGLLHLAADILHLLGAGLWLGMLPPLALVLAAARRCGGETGVDLSGMAIRRFSTVAVGAVGLVLAGGVIDTWFLAGSLTALTGTSYGRLLLAKIALFVAMLAIAAVNRLRLTPRLAAGAGGADRRLAAGRLQRNARIEAALGPAVLVIVGALGMIPSGTHAAPAWPALGGLTALSEILLALLAASLCICAVAAAAAAGAGQYRRAAAPAIGLVLSFLLGWALLQPVLTRARPAGTHPHLGDAPSAASVSPRPAALASAARCLLGSARLHPVADAWLGSVRGHAGHRSGG
jgi:copper resistance protein D